MMHAASTLVLGGARSGKSGFAEKLVRDSGLAKIYLATAEAGDGEMRERIAHHRERRGADWHTLEAPLQLAETFSREAGKDRIVLIDCLTLWLSNLMHAGRDIARETSNLIEALQSAACPAILVSNEVGLGLVPETPLGRQFRDKQGRLNQRIAAAVPNVAFVAAGLPLWLKGKAHQGVTSQ